MAKYAEGTEVPITRSRNEVERIITSHGASQFVYGEQESGWTVMFRLNGRFYRFDVADPVEFKKQSDAKYRAEQRRRWRVLVIRLKVKFDAIASGDATAEDELLAYTMLPDGSTLGESVAAPVARAYETGQMPELLPGLRALPGRSE